MSTSTTPTSPALEFRPTPLQKRGMRGAVLAQCTGCLGYLTFVNGLMLVYFTTLGIGSASVVFYLALPTLIGATLTLPAAYISDRRGKKSLGLAGASAVAAGFVCFALSGSIAHHALRQALILIGLTLYGLGQAAFNAPWYALLSPLVPEALRGRFFGNLRVSWQIVGIVFSAICAVLLLRDVSLASYQLVLVVAAAGTTLRVFCYASIPELERAEPSGRGLVESSRLALQTPGYMPFCAYVFLLTLSTASCPVMLGLIQKHVMSLSDSVVLWLGLGYMTGQLAGFWLGGKAVDRWGTKSAFLVCHLGFGLVLLAVVGRVFVPVSAAVVMVGLLQALLGSVGAASTIAISTEMLALIPPQDKSISTSLCTLLISLGGSVSGLLFAAVLKLEILQERWLLFGGVLSRYDTVLLACALAVMLLVVTLGLVPSVMGKSQWVPRGM